MKDPYAINLTPRERRSLQSVLRKIQKTLPGHHYDSHPGFFNATRMHTIGHLVGLLRKPAK